jgi:hydroxymethylpyrimidine/phosphomethylpyrimidine kinase
MPEPAIDHIIAVHDLRRPIARAVSSVLDGTTVSLRVTVVCHNVARADVADALERHRPPAVVLDPVMVATSGARLLEPEALHALRSRLLPLATVVTPNLPEAEILLERPLRSAQDMREAGAAAVGRLGAALLLKGGHAQDDDGTVTDVLFSGDSQLEIRHPRLPLEAHGTGCTLASAIAANLCRGLALDAACIAAADYVHAALQGGYRAGRSELVLLDHFGAAPR